MIDSIIQEVKLKYQTKPDRLKHIEGVVKEAVKLAEHYHANVEDAEIAAWFHDFTKYDSLEDQKSMLTPDELKTYENQPFVYHALSAAKILKKRYKVNDEIYLAVYNHVFGRIGMTLLEKIVLVADKIEPSRNYPIVNRLRELAYKDLNQTIIVYLKDIIDYHGKHEYNLKDLIINIIESLKE